MTSLEFVASLSCSTRATRGVALVAALALPGLGCSLGVDMSPGFEDSGLGCADECDDAGDTDRDPIDPSGLGTTGGDSADDGNGSTDGGSADDNDDDSVDDGSSADDSDTAGDTDGPPPPMASTMCGDWTCQPEEDDVSCPFDCVPYTIAAMGEGVGKICERSHTGFLPITEVGAGEYLGVAQGGLYPEGSNTRPAAHTDAGIAAAASVTPIDGNICLISIGMSNTYQKWQMFMTEGLASVPNLNPALQAGNGAVGSHPVDTTADANNDVWDSIDSQISGSCATSQVQVAWVLHAERGPNGSFIDEAERFHDDLRSTVINLADHFPNLKMIYLSSRAYSGYTDRDNNPEPYAHQGAFAVKWLVEEQIDDSDPALSLGSGFPWMSWGPYLWADGLGSDGQLGGTPGRTIPADGMEYACEDYAADGIHPGMGMRQKISGQLVDFFSTDPTATPWFLQ